MAPDAPLLPDDLFTAGVDQKPDKPSNIAKQVTFAKGDAAAGFRQADVIIERRYTTKPVHQAYIEPHACVVSTTPDGQVQIWASSQGQFMIRAYCAKLLGIDMANIRVTPAEIGGGFGGKTLIYLEPVALVLFARLGERLRS
jgi:CO/xanthine dehydrogenase Mo-binding subunit